MLMMLGGFGSASPGQRQLMLMTLGVWVCESPGQRQLMLMMLGGAGLKAQDSAS